MKKTVTFLLILMLLDFSSAFGVSDVINLKEYATGGQGTYENPYVGDFQQAFDDMTANGAPLYVPHYYFGLSNSIDIQYADNVKIYGEGKFLFSNITAFNIQDSENLLIRDLEFNGLSGQTSKSIAISNSLYIRISDCNFLNVQVGVNTQDGGHEIMVEDSLFETTNITNSIAIRYDNYDNYVTGNIIRGFDTGIYLDQHSASALVDSNHIYKWPSSSYSYGLYSYKSSGFTVTNNQFDNPSVAAVCMKDAANITIMGNKFQNTINDAPFIKFEQQDYQNAYRISIVGNLFKADSQLTRSIEYPSENFINTSRKHYIRDNLFDNYSPYIATSSSKTGVISQGSSQAVINFSNTLAGGVGTAFATGFHEQMSDLYVGINGAQVTVITNSPVSQDRWFNVSAQSLCVKD